MRKKKKVLGIKHFKISKVLYLTICWTILATLYLSLATIVLGSTTISDSEEEDSDLHNIYQVETVAGTGFQGARDGLFAQLNLPMSIWSGADGYLYVADTYNNLIRRISPGGIVSRFAGSIIDFDEHRFPKGYLKDGDAEEARFNRPTGGVFDSDGRLFVSDSRNHTIRMIENGKVFSFAGCGTPGFQDGEDAQFDHPHAIDIDGEGYLYIADTFNHAIRKIDPNGNVTTIAGVPKEAGFNDGYADEALFNYPMGIAVSEDGSRIYIADTGNHLIRVIEDGKVRTLAGTLLFPEDIEWENEDGEWADEPIGGFSDGLEAMFNLPIGLTFIGDVLIVADMANHSIRAIVPNGEVFTLAGTGYSDYKDGYAEESAFHLPHCVYAAGDALYIVDTGNSMIRRMLITEELRYLRQNIVIRIYYNEP